ncbi:MAG: hypothetical protein AAFV85_19345 [Cyanobacteria bacterium J06634_6]
MRYQAALRPEAFNLLIKNSISLSRFIPWRSSKNNSQRPKPVLWVITDYPKDYPHIRPADCPQDML